MKKPLFILSIFLVVFSYFAVQPALCAENIKVDGTVVVYPLPYPGILSDHPLFFLKEMRDKILLFTTRDNLKKAQLIQNLSDKHISIALKLAESGKEKLAKQELVKAEDYFLKIPTLLSKSKKEGVTASNDFISKLFQSNAKHKEVVTDIMKITNEGDINTFNIVLSKNDSALKALKKL